MMTAAFSVVGFFFFNDTATTEIYTLSLHDALPGGVRRGQRVFAGDGRAGLHAGGAGRVLRAALPRLDDRRRADRDPQEPHRGRRVRAELFAAARLGPNPHARRRS